jgi:hypothetical protein
MLLHDERGGQVSLACKCSEAEGLKRQALRPFSKDKTCPNSPCTWHRSLLRTLPKGMHREARPPDRGGGGGSSSAPTV